MEPFTTLPGGTAPRRVHITELGNGAWVEADSAAPTPITWREFAGYTAIIVFFVIAIFAALALHTGGFAP